MDLSQKNRFSKRLENLFPRENRFFDASKNDFAEKDPFSSAPTDDLSVNHSSRSLKKLSAFSPIVPTDQPHEIFTPEEELK